MEELLAQIEKALRGEVYYGALFMALCVPDICAALEDTKGDTTGRNKRLYIDWFDTNVKNKLELNEEYGDFYKGAPRAIKGSDAYFLRCSALHQGRVEHDKSSYTKIIIQEPGQRLLVTHGVVNSGVLYINLTDFCMEIVLSTRRWLAKVQGTQPFDNNYASMLARHPNGLLPFCSGFPVIATP